MWFVIGIKIVLKPCDLVYRNYLLKPCDLVFYRSSLTLQGLSAPSGQVPRSGDVDGGRTAQGTVEMGQRTRAKR